MKDIFETNFSRNLSAICLIAAPVLLLISSLTLFLPHACQNTFEAFRFTADE